MSALHMTGTDGGSLLTPLLALGLTSIFLLLPLAPFIHRVTHHVPVFLLFVFLATFIYNLVAFPFSTNHRFKFYFQQVIDLDQNTNVVTLSGIEQYSRVVLQSIPTASGQKIKCHPTPGRDLTDCWYDGSAVSPHLAQNRSMVDLISVTFPNATRDGTATLNIDAIDTRTCYLNTSQPIYGFSVEGGGKRDARFGGMPPDGFHNIQIWRRDRNRPWIVTLELKEEESSVDDDGVEGRKIGTSGDGELKAHSRGGSSALAKVDGPLEVRVSCAWSDANAPTTIPALQELRQYMPTWAAVTKRNVGLVEVRKTYKVPG